MGELCYGWLVCSMRKTVPMELTDSHESHYTYSYMNTYFVHENIHVMSSYSHTIIRIHGVNKMVCPLSVGCYQAIINLQSHLDCMNFDF